MSIQRKGIMMSNFLLISDAAKEVRVESHVLRYWEEELHLPIKRNELGHRYYTREDVERFKQIKNMKERGLQLKAIKMIMRDGKMDMLPGKKDLEQERAINVPGIVEKKQKEVLEEEVWENSTGTPQMAINIIDDKSGESGVTTESREEKSLRLQWLLQQLIKKTLQENNQLLCQDIKESVIKELDYQFRNQEEREEERARQMELRNEEYYKKMDELLRKKSRSAIMRMEKEAKEQKKEQSRQEKIRQKQEKDKQKEEKVKRENKKKEQPLQKEEVGGKIMDIQTVEKKVKKKRHFIF